jgi:hypothetical protein
MTLAQRTESAFSNGKSEKVAVMADNKQAEYSRSG